MTEFAHLHLHSEHSPLDGACRMDRLMDRVKALGMTHVGLTDHGTMSGLLKFQNAAEKAGVKSILGVELYFTEDRFVKDPSNRYYHLTALAETTEGYHNLCKISALAEKEGTYYKPRADYELLKKYGKGIIILTGCPASRTMQQIIEGDVSEAREEVLRMMECVGEENVYLEVQNAGVNLDGKNGKISQIECNRHIAKIAKDLKRPLVGTGDVHYLLKEDSIPHDSMLCVQMRTTLNNPNRMSLLPHQYHLKSLEEMREALKEQEESLAITMEIANRCNAKIETGRGQELLPKYPLPVEFNFKDTIPNKPEFQKHLSDEKWSEMWKAQVFLKELVIKGLKERYGDPLPENVVERMEYELETIINLGLPDYFLIIWDLVREATDRGIPVGPGRGCLTGDSRIWTDKGYKNISDIKVGNNIITHKGNKTKVRKTFKYDIEEELFTISPYYSGEKEITLTGDHKILVGNRLISPIKRRLFEKNQVEFESNWLEAKDITKDHYLMIPKVKPKKEKIPTWDLANLVKDIKLNQIEITIADNFIIEKTPNHQKYDYSPRQIAKNTGISANCIRDFAMKESDELTSQHKIVHDYLIDEGWNIKAWKEYYKDKKFITRKIPRFIKADEDFCRFIGLFVGDGTVVTKNKSRHYYCLVENIKENHLEDLWTKVWGTETQHRMNEITKNQNVRRLEGVSISITKLLREICPTYTGHASTKRLPNWAFDLPENNKKALLEGLWIADGYISDNTTSYTTSSEGLAYDMTTLLWSLGIPCARKKQIQTDNRKGWPTTSISYRLNMPSLDNYKQLYYSDENYIYTRIKNISSEIKETTVYDLSTKNDDCSYLTENFIAHNSGAGSIVLYGLDVTKLDPLEHGLLFERFLNPERAGGAADVDQDLSPDGRAPLMDYMREKYGEEFVAQIITFGRIKPKAGIRRAAQAMGKEYLPTADKLSKALPMDGVNAIPFKQALEESPEFKRVYNTEPGAKEIIKTAEWMEGMIQNESVHAAALLLSPIPIEDVVPIQVNKDGNTISAYDMKDAEAVGLLKLDFLGLRNLDVIYEAERLVKKDFPDFEAWKVPLDDIKTYNMMAHGNSIGVFQFESPGMQDALKSIGADRFQDLVAIVALYRPGPMDSIPVYARRKKGLEPINFGDDRLEPILGETYAITVYQEQSMQISKSLAGFTGGEADYLRKAIGKKNMELMASLKPKFMEGCKKNKVDLKLAERLWYENEKAGDYSFNKSHAAAYALVSYVTAYLKANYPLQYMAALLTSVVDNTEKVPFYLYETRKMGIEVLPPDFNKSFSGFEVENETSIRFGLTALKGVGHQVVEDIAAERNRNGDFKDMWDFMLRMENVNKRELEAMIKTGAFDSSGQPRKGLLQELEIMQKKAKSIKSNKSKGQDSLFDSLDPEAALDAMELNDEPEIPNIEFSAMEKFALEREVAGLYVSGHPLDHAKDAWEQVRNIGLGQVNYEYIGKSITVVGIITESRAIYTKKDKKKMLLLTIEDLTGSNNVIVFNKTLENNDIEKHLQEGKMAVLRVRVNEDTSGFESEVDAENTEKKVRLSLQTALPFDPKSVEVPDQYNIVIPVKYLNANFMNKLKTILVKHPGDKPVRIDISKDDEIVKKAILPEITIEPSDALTNDLRALFEMLD